MRVSWFQTEHYLGSIAAYASFIVCSKGGPADAQRQSRSRSSQPVSWARFPKGAYSSWQSCSAPGPCTQLGRRRNLWKPHGKAPASGERTFDQREDPAQSAPGGYPAAFRHGTGGQDYSLLVRTSFHCLIASAAGFAGEVLASWATGPDRRDTGGGKRPHLASGAGPLHVPGRCLRYGAVLRSSCCPG